MKNLLIGMLGFSALAFGQAATPVAPAPKVAAARAGDVVKILPIQPKDIVNGYYSTYDTLRAMYPAGSGVEMKFDSAHGTLVVRGPAAAVKLVEDTVKKLDVPVAAVRPAANVEVTVQLLYASSKEDSKGTLPADLQSTVQQLRNLFPYTNYRVMDTLFQRGRDGSQMQDEGTVAGGNTLPGGNAPMFYQFSYTPAVTETAGARSVRLRNLRMSVRQNQNQNNGGTSININTDIDAREGQKTVVGKGNVGNTEDAIFLIVTPKLIP